MMAAMCGDCFGQSALLSPAFWQLAADIIEALLGPVRRAARFILASRTRSDVTSRDLLLVIDAWATVLHLGVND